jgi:hypothetical protein
MPLAGISSVDPNTGIATYGSNTVFPRFYTDKKLNTSKVDRTKPWVKQHRDDIPPGAFWEVCHMVQVNIPGEIDSMAYEANEIYQRRWPKDWEAYKNGMDMAVSGTPLHVLFPDSPEVIAELARIRTHTVEQLAALSDTGIGHIPRGLTLRNTAQAFVLAKSGKNPEVDALKAQNEALAARLAALEAASVVPVKRGPGRPPKVQQAAEPQEVPLGIAV